MKISKETLNRSVDENSLEDAILNSDAEADTMEMSMDDNTMSIPIILPKNTKKPTSTPPIKVENQTPLREILPTPTGRNAIILFNDKFLQ